MRRQPSDRPTGVNKKKDEPRACPCFVSTIGDGRDYGLSDRTCKEQSDGIAKRSEASRYFNILHEDKLKADQKRSNKKRTSYLLVLVVAPHKGGL